MIGQWLVSVAKNFPGLAMPNRLDVPVIHAIDNLADAIPAAGIPSEIIALDRLLTKAPGSGAAMPRLQASGGLDLYANLDGEGPCSRSTPRARSAHVRWFVREWQLTATAKASIWQLRLPVAAAGRRDTKGCDHPLRLGDDANLRRDFLKRQTKDGQPFVDVSDNIGRIDPQLVEDGD